jgi:hypothetical protein
MIQCRNRASFALEPFTELCLGSFDRNDPIEASVVGLVDFAHPPAPMDARIS